MTTFKVPVPSFNERLDEIVVMARDWKEIDHEWPAMADIAWLRSVFAQFWSPDYPQPYIGTGPEDAMLSLCWMSSEENVTLEIDTANKIGDLYLAASHNNIDVECVFDLDLDNADAWRQIASELGVEFDRAGNILAASLGDLAVRDAGAFEQPAPVAKCVAVS